MVDGIRLNDSVLRAGPNDLWSTVDPYSVGSYELVLGPSSVLYGSDSMGGTLNVLPHARTDYSKPLRLRSEADRAVRVSRTNDDLPGRGRRQHGRLRSASSIGGTEAEFDDLRAGGDVGEQPHTGYGFHALDGVFRLQADQQVEPARAVPGRVAGRRAPHPSDDLRGLLSRHDRRHRPQPHARLRTRARGDHARRPRSRLLGSTAPGSRFRTSTTARTRTASGRTASATRTGSTCTRSASSRTRRRRRASAT